MLFEMKNENGEQLSPKDLYHQVFTFLVSGHETISLTATWTLYLLSKYQKIQSDLRREIKEVISDREIIWEDMDKLKLLDNCIKEALRLYPIALTTDRTSIGPDKLGTFSIPAGTHVMIGNGTLQRDERFWKDPNAFRPSRFDEISKCNLFQFLICLFQFEYLRFRISAWKKSEHMRFLKPETMFEMKWRR